MRVELLEKLPPWLARKCTIQGHYNTVDVLSKVLREMFLHEDLGKLNMADDILSYPSKIPSNFKDLTDFLEEWINKVSISNMYDAHLEPRRMWTLLQAIFKPCMEENHLFLSDWNRAYAQEDLRSEVTLEKVETFARIMLVSARQRMQELKIDNAVSQSQPRKPPAANAVTTSAGGGSNHRQNFKPDGKTCIFYMKKTGCLEGFQCAYQHPKTAGRCHNCGSPEHQEAQCTLPKPKAQAKAAASGEEQQGEANADAAETKGKERERIKDPN
eukprot:3138512-Amphidinium_carterae.1